MKNRMRSLADFLSVVTRISVLCLGSMFFRVCASAAEPVVPDFMATNLTKITPEMIASITQACPGEPAAKPEKPRKVLIFSRSENFTHDSILVAEKALTILGEKTGAFRAEVSYDYDVFDAGKLAAYDAIILNNAQQLKIPTGAAREALLDFVRGGKGIVLIHSAVSNFGDFPEAKAMVGGAGAGHPWGHYLAWRFKVEEPKHPITACFDPAGFSMKDEQYQYDQNNTGRQNVRVLVSMDMSDPVTAKDDKGKRRGFRTDGFNPVVWIRQAGKGRVFVNGFGHNKEGCWDSRLLKLNLAGIQYAIGDLKADDAIVANNSASPTIAVVPQKSAESSAVAGDGMKASWWNNNSLSGEPVITTVVTKFNPILDGPAAPFPATTPPLGPEFVSARFTGTFIPKISGEYKFVSNADDYVALWINGFEEIAWSGHTAEDRFSAHSINLVKDTPLKIRIDYRQDKLGYKLTLRLAHQPDGEQIDFGPSVGEFIPAEKQNFQ